MMLRGRKSLHNDDASAVATGIAIYNGHKHVYNNNKSKNYYNNMKNEYWYKNNQSENMQGKHFTQSSNAEYLTETTDSFTTSTTSLLSQEQQNEQPHRQQQEQNQRGHGILTQRGFPFKRSHYTTTATSTTITTTATAIATSTMATMLKISPALSGDGYAAGSNFGNILLNAQKPKRNHTKLQLPGGARWHTHNNPPVLQVAAAATREQHSSSKSSLLPAYNSIRRIRRPRQWLPQQSQFAQHQQRNETGQIDANSFEEYDEEKPNITEKGRAFCIEFLQGSSIHGFIYMAKFGLSIVERLLWFAFICVALFSIISLSRRTWERFQNSPMVISMDRNKLVWNTSFPSLTVCPHKRIDELKVEDYMIENEKFFPTEEDKEDFRDFILKLASLTYENMETLPVNKTFGIPSEKYLDLLYELKWNFEPEMSSGAAVKMYIYETLTEFGICHSVNSLVARYNGYDYWRSNDWNLLEHGDRVTVHPLDGEIYAQIINLSTAYDVYFHGAGDIPNISKQRYTFPESDYTTVELIALEIYTAEEARAFTTKQRKCRFQYEAEEMMTVPIYSFGLCLAECRMKFSMRVCGCVPHFYRNRLKSGRVLPVCGFKGLACLANIKRDIISLKSDRYKINCNCLSNCDDSNFFVQSYRSRVWFLGANLQWGIIDYPKMQLRRDVLFSFADVLVYIGGLVGFFLGCSMLSFTEVIYYFTVRFVKRMFFN